MKINKPALRYYGGKWNLAPWIISHFPPHTHYIDLCGGAANVLLRKPRSDIETYNDLDGNVVNFFKQLRDRPDDLIRAIGLTPWAREEYKLHQEPIEDGLEMARRFWVGCVMSITHMAYTSSGMKMEKTSKHKAGKSDLLVQADVSHLEQVARRFKQVQIECKSYEEILTMYDHKDALFYFDPPYVKGSRSSTGIYAFEWSDADHIKAANLLERVEGYVIVSGYNCSLYDGIYTGWSRVDCKAKINASGYRLESLWLSPQTVYALEKAAALIGPSIFDMPGGKP